MTVESENAKEEIKELIEKCIKCGRCKSLCPVFKVIKEEQISPRGQVVVLNNDYFEKIVYDCSLCKGCEEKCPMDLKICDAILKARKVLIGQKKEISKNKELIRNLNKTGNIYGIRDGF